MNANETYFRNRFLFLAVLVVVVSVVCMLAGCAVGVPATGIVKQKTFEPAVAASHKIVKPTGLPADSADWVLWIASDDDGDVHRVEVEQDLWELTSVGDYWVNPRTIPHESKWAPPAGPPPSPLGMDPSPALFDPPQHPAHYAPTMQDPHELFPPPLLQTHPVDARY